MEAASTNCRPNLFPLRISPDHKNNRMANTENILLQKLNASGLTTEQSRRAVRLAADWFSHTLPIGGITVSRFLLEQLDPLAQDGPPSGR
ncbi:MAG TPA: hypothetical protein VHK69_01180 [Chitinophagaceae bacterium]|jgi:hypothetical protein|nr:hypothetical protein [Chitinophagaceae bacterium]